MSETTMDLSKEEISLLLTALDWFEDEYPVRHNEQSQGKIHEAHRFKAEVDSLKKKLENAREK